MGNFRLWLAVSILMSSHAEKSGSPLASCPESDCGLLAQALLQLPMLASPHIVMIQAWKVARLRHHPPPRHRLRQTAPPAVLHMCKGRLSGEWHQDVNAGSRASAYPRPRPE